MRETIKEAIYNLLGTAVVLGVFIGILLTADAFFGIGGAILVMFPAVIAAVYVQDWIIELQL